MEALISRARAARRSDEVCQHRGSVRYAARTHYIMRGRPRQDSFASRATSTARAAPARAGRGRPAHCLRETGAARARAANASEARGPACGVRALVPARYASHARPGRARSYDQVTSRYPVSRGKSLALPLSVLLALPIHCRKSTSLPRSYTSYTRIVTEVPKISEEVINSGRRFPPKTIRAGVPRRAQDENGVMSKSAVGFPLVGSRLIFNWNGTSSAWPCCSTSSGPSSSLLRRRTT